MSYLEQHVERKGEGDCYAQILYPEMPESRAIVHFGSEWILTASGEDFLMEDDGEGEDRLVMFAMYLY